MDQNGPPVPPSDFLCGLLSGRTSADIDPPPVPCANDSPEGPSDAVYYRSDEEVREGFLIALRAMGVADVEQQPERVKPPDGGVKP